MLESLFNKVTMLKACNFIQEKPQHRCFPVKNAKFSRTHFFAEHIRLWLFKCSKTIRKKKLFIRKNIYMVFIKTLFFSVKIFFVSNKVIYLK